MQYRLRTVFAVTIVLAILLTCHTVTENTWFGPARIGIEAQAKFNRLIVENQWDGYIAPTHYLKNVQILLNNVEETEIRKLYPTLHEISWLRHIRIHAPSLSQQMLLEMQTEFPDVTIQMDIPPL